MKFPTNQTLTELLNKARAVAIYHMAGAAATPGELDKLAERIRFAILRQAALGEWRAVGINDPDDLLPLKVTARLGNTLIGEAPIVIAYDFSRTVRPDIVVACDPVPS